MTRSRAANHASRSYDLRIATWGRRVLRVVRSPRSPWSRSGLRGGEIAAAMLFLAMVCIVGFHLDHDRIRELEISGRQLDMIAAELARGIDAALIASPTADPGEA